MTALNGIMLIAWSAALTSPFCAARCRMWSGAKIFR
jgi:hypothetical protein